MDQPPTIAEWRAVQEQLDAAIVRASVDYQRGRMTESESWSALAFNQRLWTRAAAAIAEAEAAA